MTEQTPATAQQATRQVTEREARQVAEAAREQSWTQPSFGKQLYLGDFQLDLIHPLPAGQQLLAQVLLRAVNGCLAGTTAARAA